MKRAVFSTLSALVLALGLLVGMHEIRQAAAACSIAWDNNVPTCTETDMSGNFDYDLDTSWVSQFQDDWTMAHGWEVANSVNVADLDITPSSGHGINIINPEIMQADVVTPHMEGVLEEEETEGVAQTGHVDATFFNCADSRAMNLKAPDGC